MPARMLVESGMATYYAVGDFHKARCWQDIQWSAARNGEPGAGPPADGDSVVFYLGKRSFPPPGWVNTGRPQLASVEFCTADQFHPHRVHALACPHNGPPYHPFRPHP